MLIKRPIYNTSLKCVAYEIIINEHSNDLTEIQPHFTAVMDSTEKSLPVFTPYVLKPLVENDEANFENPIILKLHANDIGHIFPKEEIENNTFSTALFIDDIRQLPWLNFADYIAMNDSLMKAKDAEKVIKFSHSKNRKVIAYDISTPQAFDLCKSWAMDFYCGDFLHKTNDSSKTEIAGNKLSVIALLNVLHQKDTDFDEVSKVIQKDAVLSYQLLKLVNSVVFSSYEPIESIQQAVIRLGLVNLKNWVMVLSMRNVTNKPIEIVESGLIRAHMAEKLAEAHGALSKQCAYTTGLFSVLDSLLDTPMETLIEKITLSDDIKAALLSRVGPLGELLNVVIAYEEGHWDELGADEYHGLDLSQVYVDCLQLVAAGKTAMGSDKA